jgi:endoglucanase
MRARGDRDACLAGQILFCLMGMATAIASAPRFLPADSQVVFDHHAVVRGVVTEKKLALVFTGDEFADGGSQLANLLKAKKIRAGFFFTGRFYRNPAFQTLIKQLQADGHYLGPHSDRHLLYCSWSHRDSSLVSRETFCADLQANYRAMASLGITVADSFFIPPYEWYNREQVDWAASMGITLFNFTPAIGTQADYTIPSMSGYCSSSSLYRRLFDFEAHDAHGLNGAILLMHIGTHPERSDKFYLLLEPILDRLQAKGYALVRIDTLLARL